MSIKKRAISGVRVTSISTFIITAAQLTQVAVLARFLDPDDFGLMAVIMVIIGFSQAFQDMGISNAIIQKRVVSHEQLSSLYWLNIGSGLLLGMLLLAISPLIAEFYGEPKIKELLAAMSVVFPLIAVGNQYRVLFQKELEFKIMEVINVIAAIISLITAIILAIDGFSVMALVIAMIAQSGTASLLFLVIGSSRFHKPLLLYRHSDVRGFLGFGLYQMGERSINYISANADKLLIGKLVGMDAAGFYNLAWQLVIFPLAKINPIINKVAFPVYSKLQNDLVALNSYYVLSVKVLSLVIMPLLAFLMFFSYDIVLVVFGGGWKNTSELLPALALIGVLRAIGNPGGALILALGRPEIGFWWNLVWAFVVIISLIVALVVSPSANTAVYVLVGLSFSFGLIWHFLIAKIGNIDYAPILKHLIKLFTVVTSIAWMGNLATDSTGLSNPFLRVIFGAFICSISYIVFLLCFEKKLFLVLKEDI